MTKSLGVPRDLAVVDPNATPQDVAKVIELARKARDRFPTRYRLIVWICLNEVWWEKVAGQWAKEREYQLFDLKQLPQGQWYATRQNLRTYDNPERKTHGHEITRNLDLRLLEEKDFPPDLFNGDKLLEKAKREGVLIETY